MSFEIELKFRIPARRLAAVRRAVASAGAQRIALAARYLDTPAQDLARARSALRLRWEGDHWVQTLKAEGEGALRRLEHEVPLAPDAAPVLDLARHDGSAAGALLATVLRQAADPQLVERYGTEVQRTRRLLRHRGALIELALDEGEIVAQGGARRLPICELEFELKAGPPAALLSLCAAWAQRFDLVLDLRSKSERGHLLAAGQPWSPPTPALAAGRRAPAASAAAQLGRVLQPALRNASLLAELPGETGHRQALQQALTALQAVAAVAAQPPEAPGGPDSRLPAPADCVPALAALRTVVASAPARAALAPRLWPQAAAQVPPLADWLSLPGVQRLWLALLAASLAPA